MKDVFEDGYVDVAVFQPTYLKEWYTDGFNTTERNAALGEKHPGKFIANTRFDPRDGDVGLVELARNVERYGSKGVKLYTAEWNNGSRGYKLSDPAAYRSWRRPRNSASRTSTCTRARRSGRWTRTRSTCPTWTTPRPTSPS
jgi:predicted TIM-barrel fold metal-dependent hydrolase